MFLVKSKAPTRIDIAGGTLDLWPIANLLEKKATVNLGISLFAECEIQLAKGSDYILYSHDLDKKVSGDLKSCASIDGLPLLGMILNALWDSKLPPLKISTRAGSPPGAGLGGSSAMGVAIASALWRFRQIYENVEDLPEMDLVNLVKNIESKLIHAPTGTQDYWGAIRGRINIMSYPFSGETIETLAIKDFDFFNNHFMFFYTGVSRASADNNWQVFKAIFDGKKSVIKLFQEIGEHAYNCAEALREKDFESVLRHSQSEWHARCKVWKDIETPETKNLDAVAREYGALFTRLGGAGGGGVMLVVAPPECHQVLKTKLVDAGVRHLEAHIVDKGIEIKAEKVQS